MAAHLIAVTGAATLNEAQATKRLAARLPDDWIVFANISPQFVPARRGSRASEVDCLILGKSMTIIVDLKAHSGEVIAYNGRPWTLNGAEFANRNGKPVAANKQHGFYASLEKRSYDFKDLFTRGGFDAFVSARVVFSAADVSIVNPTDALLASTLEDFVAEVVKEDAGRRKALPREMVKFALSHFTEGDEGRWPPIYRSAETPNSRKVDPNAENCSAQLRAEKARLEQIVMMQEGEIGRLKKELAELKSGQESESDPNYAQKDSKNPGGMDDKKERAFLMVEEIAISKMRDRKDLYYRNSPSELLSKLDAIPLMDKPNIVFMLKYYAFDHFNYLLSGKGRLSEESEIEKIRDRLISFDLLKICFFLAFAVSFLIWTYESPSPGIEPNFLIFSVFALSIVFIQSSIIYFRSIDICYTPKYEKTGKDNKFLYFTVDVYVKLVIFSALPIVLMLIGFAQPARERILLTRYFEGWDSFDLVAYIAISSVLIWGLTRPRQQLSLLDGSKATKK